MITRVAQMRRAVALQAEGRGFESLLGYQCAGSSTAERQPSKLNALGSTPSRRSNEEWSSSSMVERSPYKRVMASSSLPSASITLIPTLPGSSSAEQSMRLLTAGSRVRIPPARPVGRRRRHRWPMKRRRIAQWEEQQAFNPKVVSSSLTAPANFGRQIKHGLVAQLVEQVAPNHKVLGSIPSEPTNGSVVQLVGHRSPKPRMSVRVRPDPPVELWRAHVAQPEERELAMLEVAGSRPAVCSSRAPEAQ